MLDDGDNKEIGKEEGEEEEPCYQREDEGCRPDKLCASALRASCTSPTTSSSLLPFSIYWREAKARFTAIPMFKIISYHSSKSM